jgi:hypothetical protein
LEGGSKFLFEGVGAILLVLGTGREAGGEAADFGDQGQGAGQGGQLGGIQAFAAQVALEGFEQIVGDLPFALPDGGGALGPAEAGQAGQGGFARGAGGEEAGLMAADPANPVKIVRPAVNGAEAGAGGAGDGGEAALAGELEIDEEGAKGVGRLPGRRGEQRCGG